MNAYCHSILILNISFSISIHTTFTIYIFSIEARDTAVIQTSVHKMRISHKHIICTNWKFASYYSFGSHWNSIMAGCFSCSLYKLRHTSLSLYSISGDFRRLQRRKRFFSIRILQKIRKKSHPIKQFVVYGTRSLVVSFQLNVTISLDMRLC